MKKSQIETENDKNPTIFQISKILCSFFSKFLTDLMDWNVEKGQQGKNVLSTRLFRRVLFSFRFEIVLNYQRKWQKPKKFLIFKVFKHFY